MVGVKRKTKVRVQRASRYGRYRSRSKKLKYVKTPGGKTVVHYKKKKSSKAKCSSCGAVLPGTLTKTVAKMKNTLKTKKLPSRPFGGNLCSRCMRRKLIKEARKLTKLVPKTGV